MPAKTEKKKPVERAKISWYITARCIKVGKKSFYTSFQSKARTFKFQLFK